jgi:hypothetical protein
VGVDISPSSQRFTETQLAALGVADRVIAPSCATLPQSRWSRKPTGWCAWKCWSIWTIPLAFLRGLRRNMAPGAKAFITAALNAAHADHIYLYRNGGEVLAHLIEAASRSSNRSSAWLTSHRRTGVPVPEAAFIVY